MPRASANIAAYRHRLSHGIIGLPTIIAIIGGGLIVGILIVSIMSALLGITELAL